MINAFGVDRNIAKKHEDFIAKEMQRFVASERKARWQLPLQSGYAGAPLTAERHRVARELSDKVLAYIAGQTEEVTRQQIISALSSDSESAVRYAVEKLRRECRIIARRPTIHSRIVKFTAAEDAEQ